MHRTVVVSVAVALVTSAVIGAGTLALAHHRWSDVPTGNAFHDDISALTSAGCATGYADGTFRPTAPVNRQQAARFVRSCGGRLVNTDTDSTVNVSTSGTTLRSATMQPGALATGGGQVLAVATVEVSYFTPATLPCSVIVSLSSSTHSGTESVSVVWGSSTAESFHTEQVTLTQRWEAGAGQGVNVSLSAVKLSDCAATASAVRAEGEISLMYFPFTGTGQGTGT